MNFNEIKPGQVVDRTYWENLPIKEQICLDGDFKDSPVKMLTKVFLNNINALSIEFTELLTVNSAKLKVRLDGGGITYITVKA